MSKEIKKNLSSAFDLAPLERYDPKQDKSNPITLEPQDDSEFARNNIRDMIEKTSDIFGELVENVASTGDHKDVVALSSIMKTIVDANKTLLDLKKTKKEVEKLDLDVEDRKNAKDGNLKITHNNLYITTSDLLKMIKEQAQNKEKEIENG